MTCHTVGTHLPNLFGLFGKRSMGNNQSRHIWSTEFRHPKLVNPYRQTPAHFTTIFFIYFQFRRRKLLPMLCFGSPIIGVESTHDGKKVTPKQNKKNAQNTKRMISIFECRLRLISHIRAARTRRKKVANIFRGKCVANCK